ncbi:MAG: sugar transporter permease [Paenibacillaceae bacterium]|jgi:putative aldouronate transport system permease protein|nr:sugar transporter permease [Paenibacillaceae bacterium]
MSNATKTMPPAGIAGARPDILKRMVKHKLLYLLLSGALVWNVIFNYIPMAGVIVAFQEYDIFKGVMGSPFVGLKHFIDIFQVPALQKAILNTLLYSGVKLLFGFPLTVIFALLLNEIRHMMFKRVIQTISYLPHFLSWIAVASLGYSFFELYGPFNDLRQFIMGADAARLNILMDPDYFLGVIFFSSVFKEIGWGTIIYLAAISGIDSQLYEAAVMDGCGRFKQALHITLPGIVPTAMILFILSAGGILNANFEQIIGFQNLYTQQQTEVINTIVYKYGLQQGNFSLSTAFGLMQGVVSFIILYLVNKLAKKVSNVGLW